MAIDLEFPRLVYRGDPDTLGTGADANGVALNSETKRCEHQGQWDQDLKDGWRLTREIDAPAADQADAIEPATDEALPNDASKGKKAKK